jgi:gamma-glutamyltranspeptidase/glutathione hydrolase
MFFTKNHGVIAAGHQATAQAGMEILNSGGNAFDGAIASMLTSCVAEPGLTSLGGGGFFLAHTADHRNILYDFFPQTPVNKKPVRDLNFYPVDVNFGGSIQEFHIGLGSMAVPGHIAGIFHIHAKLGKLPLRVVAEPAINYARNGLMINNFQNYLMGILEPIFLASEAGRKIYASPAGKLLNQGDNLIMSDFANTLEYLVVEGAKAFYQGDIGKKLIDDCQAQGGYLTVDDLAHYQVIEREPLLINYRGNTFLTNPPPSAGGTLIAFALELLTKIDFTHITFGTAEHLHILADVMRLTNIARKSGFDQNIYQSNVIQEFLGETNINYYQEMLVEQNNFVTQKVNKLGSTTHISVIDDQGNAASVTTSNGEGSGYIIPGTGMMMNNMLGEEDLHPHGFHQWQTNVRISSMMSPTIVLKNDQPEIVLGSGGSNRIRTAILQVISNIIDFKMSVRDAVNSPRVHWENNHFHIEPGFSPSELDQLNLPADNQINFWQEKNMFFGGVNTVLENTNGLISGAGDGRRDGVSLPDQGFCLNQLTN